MMTFAKIGVYLLLCVGIACAPALGADYTFSVTTGNWANSSNWTPTGIPGSGDKAIIPTGKTCIIPSGGSVTIETIDIEADVSTNGTIEVELDSTLTLGASGSTSTIDGKLIFDDDGSGDGGLLIVKNDMTINGSGSIVGAPSVGEITYETTNYRLTIDGSVKVTGGVTISCKFTNSATVDADTPFESIVLANGSDPQGNGDWKVTDADATLKFEDSATGGALSGDFTIGGTLDIDQNVYTTGELKLQEDGVIDVASGKRFKASILGI